MCHHLHCDRRNRHNTLLVGLKGGVILARANTILHVVLPIYAVINWIVFADRSPLRWRLIWVSLSFPIVWIIVVLIRRTTDGWVPHPLLDPTLGYPVVLLYFAAIAVAP
ncbi:MAG: Pr6Pr family membrane protein [Microbacteriaceae bacterium]|nr:Pr6Pr family membrane protein [Microbacteriaceae bacterium]